MKYVGSFEPTIQVLLEQELGMAYKKLKKILPFTSQYACRLIVSPGLSVSDIYKEQFHSGIASRVSSYLKHH